jgi:hypothetical protein
MVAPVNPALTGATNFRAIGHIGADATFSQVGKIHGHA